MTYKTLLELKTEIKRDVDMEDEDFVQDDELTAYINEYIQEAESCILTLFEDYFLTESTINLVNGTSEYSLPSDIYADKIRGVIYSNGSVIWPVKRLRNLNKFEKIQQLRNMTASAGQYWYFIKNATTGIKLVLVPTAVETVTGGLKIFYIRNAKTLSLDADQCDIPQFYNFVKQGAKVRCLMKEGNPLADMEKAKLEELRQLMVDSLSRMVIDDDDTIEMDTSHYWEHS